MKRSSWFIAFAVLCTVVLWMEGGSQGLDQMVTVRKLVQPGTTTQDSFAVPKTVLDTSAFFAPATYTGLVFSAGGDSVDVYAVVQCGNDTILAREDSLRVVGAQNVVWMLNLSIAQKARVIFKRGSAANGSKTKIKGAQVNTQW